MAVGGLWFCSVEYDYCCCYYFVIHTMPSTTFPNTTCFSSNHLVLCMMMKNWELLVSFSPLFAMDTYPAMHQIRANSNYYFYHLLHSANCPSQKERTVGRNILLNSRHVLDRTTSLFQEMIVQKSILFCTGGSRNLDLNSLQKKRKN